MEDSIKNREFHSDMDRIFESYLSQEDKPQIMIKDKRSEKIIEDMNYSKVFFDTDLNIYKKDKNSGALIKVDNPDFEAVVIKKQ